MSRSGEARGHGDGCGPSVRVVCPSRHRPPRRCGPAPGAYPVCSGRHPPGRRARHHPSVKTTSPVESVASRSRQVTARRRPRPVAERRRSTERARDAAPAGVRAARQRRRAEPRPSNLPTRASHGASTCPTHLHVRPRRSTARSDRALPAPRAFGHGDRGGDPRHPSSHDAHLRGRLRTSLRWHGGPEARGFSRQPDTARRTAFRERR